MTPRERRYHTENKALRGMFPARITHCKRKVKLVATYHSTGRLWQTQPSTFEEVVVQMYTRTTLYSEDFLNMVAPVQPINFITGRDEYRYYIPNPRITAGDNITISYDNEDFINGTVTITASTG